MYDYTNSTVVGQYNTGEMNVYNDSTRTVEVNYGPAVITASVVITGSTAYKLRYSNYQTSKQLQAFSTADKIVTCMITKLA